MLPFHHGRLDPPIQGTKRRVCNLNVHGGSFMEPQILAVLLTDAVTNRSAWAVAFHTALALKEGMNPAFRAARMRWNRGNTDRDRPAE
jgi:hypothetical protein